MTQEAAMDKFLKITEKVLLDYDYVEYLINPHLPGPHYYEGCDDGAM